MLSQLGLLYIYVLLATLTISLGYAGYRGINRLIGWTFVSLGDEVQIGPESRKRKTLNRGDDLWIRMALVSAAVLFLCVFALGALKTMGIGENAHNHQSAQGNPLPAVQNGIMPSSYSINADWQALMEMQKQLNNMEYQLTQMQAAFNR